MVVSARMYIPKEEPCQLFTLYREAGLQAGELEVSRQMGSNTESQGRLGKGVQKVGACVFSALLRKSDFVAGSFQEDSTLQH